MIPAIYPDVSSIHGSNDVSSIKTTFHISDGYDVSSLLSATQRGSNTSSSAPFDVLSSCFPVFQLSGGNRLKTNDAIHLMYFFVFDPLTILKHLRYDVSSNKAAIASITQSSWYFADLLQCYCSFLNEIVTFIKESHDGKHGRRGRGDNNDDDDDMDDGSANYNEQFKVAIYFTACCLVKFMSSSSTSSNDEGDVGGSSKGQSKKATAKKTRGPLSQVECDKVREQALEALTASLFVNKPGSSSRADLMQVVWSGRTPDDSFLNIYLKLASLVIERASLSKSGAGVLNLEGDDFGLSEDVAASTTGAKKGKKTKASAQSLEEKFSVDSKSHKLVVELMCSLIYKYYKEVSQSALAAVQQMISSSAYGAETAACIVEVLSPSEKQTSFQLPAFANELFIEIERSASSKNGLSDSIKLKGLFIEEVSKKAQKTVISNLSVLRPLLNCDEPNIRNSIIKTFGNLLIYLRQLEQATNSNQSSSDGNENFSSMASLENTKQTRDKLLKILLERIHDVNQACRSAALKVWADLAKNKAIPLSQIQPLASLAIGRLSDKSSFVRKDAITLLVSLLEDNPYNSNLDSSFFNQKVTEVQDWMSENMSRLNKENENRLAQREETIKQRKEIRKERKRRESLARGLQVMEEEEDDEEDDRDAEDDIVMELEVENNNTLLLQPETELERTRNEKIQLMEYCQNALMFIEMMNKVCDSLLPFLLSKNVSDVQSVVKFFTKAHEFHIPNAEKGIRQMLLLIWDTRDSGKVKKELMENFEELYIMSSNANPPKPFEPSLIARNLVSLASNATLAELTSLEQVIGEAMKNDGVLKKRILPKAAIDALWDIAIQMKNENSEDAKAALSIIGMAASVLPTVVSNHESIQRLLDIGFGDQTKLAKDYSLVRYSCSALIPALTSLNKSVLNDEERVSYLQSIEEKIEEFLTHTNGWEMVSASKDQKGSSSRKTAANDVPNKETDSYSQWFPAAENSIALLFLVNNKPEIVCSSIIKKLHEYTFKSSPKTSVEMLSRLLFVVGHSAIKLLVFAERTAQEARRKRNALEDLKAQGLHPVGDSKKSKSSSKDGKPSSEDDGAKGKGDSAHDDAGEVDMLGASGEEDTEDTLAREIAENELVAPGTLLGSYVPLIKDLIQKDPDLNKNLNNKLNEESETSEARRRLQEAAVLVLCKFMAVSSKFCEDNLGFLFAILRDARSSTVRANIVISLGDLASRYPNQFEPYATYMYEKLRDEDVGVRKNTLMVCAHLILNDMVKVKENISEISLCTEDDDPRIQDLAQLFFSELSKKSGTPIFNLIPDIIGKLSADREVDKKKFRTIAKFLLDFVPKDSKADNIAERLCKRIHTATGHASEGDNLASTEIASIDQCRDYAFSIEQLTLSDKMAKRMSDELFKCYQPCLGDEEIFQSFCRIANNHSRSNPQKNDQENKRISEEWNAKLLKCHQELGANDKVIKNAQKARGKTKKTKQ